MSLSISSQVDRLKDALVSAASSEALCMLIHSLDDNEEAKRRRDVEKEELAVSQQESSIIANAHHSSAPEDNINTLIDEWMNSRLGQLSLRDNNHVVLDTSKSSILKDIPLSLEGGTRFRCLLKQPRDCEAAFGVENLHPLGGSMEAMKIAQAATQAMTPSIAVNHAIWEQFSETIK
ncbi:unnamed protein product [Hydatigera taeniaeformis]|uniref:Uncharacterized protein n=1 Tax=Hydatigena taeniaeformis TaxID=6205 RepID=A0A0R3WM31_HYDTA|nr:unnamed protein product [Hydatigera taeniaeformis]